MKMVFTYIYPFTLVPLQALFLFSVSAHQHWIPYALSCVGEDGLVTFKASESSRNHPGVFHHESWRIGLSDNDVTMQ